jgi:chloramphenicol-sensitive protein RarD
VNQLRRGYLFGIAAYVCWGVFPIYFKMLSPATPLEILAHRVIWSALFVAVILSVLRAWSFVPVLARRRRTLAAIGLAAILISINWGTYIYAVSANHVVESSLGYFITPLVSVVLGVLVLGERMRRWQWVAIGIGTVAVAVLTLDYGRPPWIALTLAASFGAYGLVKKRLGLPPAEGLFVESAALAVPGVAYLALITVQGHSSLGDSSPGRSPALHIALLIASGAVTAVPLLLFAGAANRIPLSELGILQYIAPIFQLAIGVGIFHEPMPPARLAGFALVWLALAIFTWDAVRAVRRGRRERAAAPGALVGADQATS